MKAFLRTFSVALLVPTFAMGAALDIRMSQRNSSNTAWMDVIFTKQNSSLIGTSSTGIPSIVTIGSGLDLTSGVLTATGGGGGAPTTATYITQTPNGSLSNGQALSLLSSGIMRVATTTGAITSLGDPTTVGLSFMSLTNPSAIRFPRINADNTVDALSDSDFRTAIGAGTGSGNVTNNATLTAGRVLLGGGTTVVGVIGAATNGQILIGRTDTGAMQLGTITAGDNIVITNSAGGITINSTASGTGNVTNNASLTANNIIAGNGTTGIGPTTIGWNATNSTVTIGAAGAGNIIANVATIQTGSYVTLNATTLNISTAIDVPSGGSGRSTGTTAYALIATGTTATGAQQTLASGATTEMLVGGGASALPVWTTANGSGAPLRTTGATGVSFATLDTGQGANELYGMDQNVLTTSAPQFSNVQITNSTLTYSTTPAVDFAGDGFKTITLTGDATFSGSNYAAGRSVTVRIVGDASTRNLAFDADWIFIGAAAPTTLAANKVAVLTLTSFTGADTGVIAAYSAQP